MWALPSVLFLIFMVRFPYEWEVALGTPLQKLATTTSCWLLQCLGQPAIANGTTILLYEHHLEVERACAGLRMFTGIIALACAYLLLTPRSLIEKALLFLLVIPVALVANAIRIAVTGLLYVYVSSSAGEAFSHDVAGWGMIALSAGLFALVLWYLKHLFHEVEIATRKELVRPARAF
jgi:exosortase